MSNRFLAALLALYFFVFGQAAYAGSLGGVFQLPSYVPTYSASSGFFTPVSAATDVFQITGSSSKTIKVLKVFVTFEGNASGTGPAQEFYTIKRSTADSGGTLTSMTAVPLDSTNPAASAAACVYTANPTVGTAVGTINVTEFCAWNNSVGSQGGSVPQECVFDADKYGSAAVLRGTNEALCLNLNAAAYCVTSPKMQVTAIWTEQ